MTRRRVLVPAAMAVGVAVLTFLALAASPRWQIMWLGPYEIGYTKGSLFAWLRKDRALSPEERQVAGYPGVAERNAAEAWRVVGTALAAGLGAVPAYLVLRWMWGVVAPIARPW